MTADLVLGGYPAKRCARAVHNDFSPASPPKPPVDEQTRRLFSAGNEFEEHVNAELAAGGALLLSDDAGFEANATATLDAMRNGIPVIVNGRLPRVKARVGAPDVLVRLGAGYVPVDVKLHGTRTPAARRSVWLSPLDDPAELRLVEGLSEAHGHLEKDGIQLAHYTRMLQELGLHAGDAHLVGGIIGSSDFEADVGRVRMVQWLDLAGPRRTTYSASAPSGRAQRSLLERYDHEFAFRLEVAAAAASGGEIVRPFHIYECRTCPWLQYCTGLVGPRDASFAIATGLPSAQQWRLLYDTGTTTVDALAVHDPDRAPDGWDERDSQPGPRAADRFAALVRRARMTVAGVEYEPLSRWPQVPQADVEVDFDIEWDLDGHIYLWGLRVRDGQDDSTAVFDPVVSYEPIDQAGEAELAAEFAARLGAVVAAEESAGRSVTVFHWSHPERSMTRKYPEVDRLLEGRAVDLCAWYGQHFLSRAGASLKVVAPMFGFRWAVDDAGGAQSQLKIEAARGEGPAADEARAWLHRYNESDVAAQAAIRDGLRAAAGDAG